jgi:hypothetical protein
MLRACVAFLLFTNAFGVAAAQTAPAGQSEPKPAAPKQAPAKQPAAKPAAPKQAAAPADGKCVGLVSRLGEAFGVSKVGFTVLQNEEREAPIDSWRIDEFVAARIETFLNRRMAVRRITYPRNAFASVDAVKLFRNTDTEIGAVLRTIAAGTRCARYVVVTREITQFVNYNRPVTGLGIVVLSGFRDVYWLHAIAALRVYDGETFAPLMRKSTSIGQSNWTSEIRGPNRQVDKSFWPESSDVTQNGKLRDGIRDLLAQSIDMTLPELKLME